MPEIFANGLRLTYEESGPTDGPAILLIMGLAAQLVDWPSDLIERLNRAGYRTVAFDNRDIGLSEKLSHRRAPNIFCHMLLRRFGLRGLAPYDLEDMADDARAVLDGLNIELAHVVGVSMGGMIAQILAGKNPNRVASLTAIMTSTNQPGLPGARRDVARLFLRPGPPARTPDEAIEKSMRIWNLIKTQDGGWTDDELLARVSASAHRSTYPPGPKRQTAAIVESGDLRRWSRKIEAPTLVIHGDADALVNIAGGRAVAKAVANAKFVTIPDMGHDLPPDRTGQIADQILIHLDQA